MNKPRESRLIAKLKEPPPQRVAEVEDFIERGQLKRKAGQAA